MRTTQNKTLLLKIKTTQAANQAIFALKALGRADISVLFLL
jgi:hypothetical protein